jgi:ribonucleoside-diphosphate reductase alpha chain
MQLKEIDTKQFLSDSKFYEGYSRFRDDLNRYETWEEAVERVMNMHREYYAEKMSPELSSLIDRAEKLYKDKVILGAQRALQFGGEQLLKNPMRLYNCLFTHASRVEFFGETFHGLLCVRIHKRIGGRSGNPHCDGAGS